MAENNTNGDGEPSGTGNIPEIELIIKASTIDGRRKGACLFCHEYFMDLYLLAELKTISLKITTVDMLKLKIPVLVLPVQMVKTVLGLAMGMVA